MDDIINNDLMSLVLKKNELSRLDYNDPTYDTIEEELHDMEDAFLENHGKDMENVFHEVHKMLKIDNEVLLPIAYLAKKYSIKKENNNTEFSVALNEGVIVESDKYDNKITRLVLVPNPTRILLQVEGSHQEEVWKQKG